MNPFSHFISILLTIGSFLGLPSTPLPPPLPPHFDTIPKISLPAINPPATTTFNSIPLTPTTSKGKKLPTLSLSTPTFNPIKIKAPATTSNLPQITNTSLPTFTPIPSSTIPSTEVGPTPTPTIQPSVNSTKSPANATVNIYCTTQVGNTITAVTGSGIIIDPKGVILTNAHVAEHILLTDFLNQPNKKCLIRKGSPAISLYTADLLYISPSWIKAHGDEINQTTQSQETGEGDYALLLIDGTVSGGLPSSFPFISSDVSDNSLANRTAVFAIGYPAGNLSGGEVVNNLRIESDNIYIADGYSFRASGVDLIRTTATPIAERGASGGGILNTNGNLIGLIATTIPDQNSSGAKDLQALTLSYINHDLEQKTSYSLVEFLNRDLRAVAKDFKTTNEPDLASYLPH
jgi:hypothetical protein